MDLFKEREKDISIRGKDLLVYNFNNKIKKLCECEIWTDNEDKYVKPKKITELKYHSFCTIS